MTVAQKRSLDGRGKTITTYVVFAAAAELRSMKQGEVLELLTDEFEPFRHDIAAWCEASGNVLRSVDRATTGLVFEIEKGSRPGKESSLAIVISVDGLEELLSPLGFALAAALEGIDVHLYFQGPAVRVLTRGFRPRLKGWGRPFSRFAAAGMAKSGHIAAQEKLQQLRTMGGRIYACGGSMPHFKVSKEDLMFDDLPIIEYLSFMPIMEKADVSLYV